MKRRTTKAQIRAAMQQEIDAFLLHGGEIEEIAQGISGREFPTKAIPQSVFDEPSQSRTDVSDILRDIDTRKKNPPIQPTPKKPKKKLIYDDFGEPLRWVWIDR